DPVVASSVMPVDSAHALLEALGQHRLLDPAQLSELQQPPGPFIEVRTLAQELLRRGWLTAYQVNQLLLGRGAELRLGSSILLQGLGEDAIGQLFKARHVTMQRAVAVKVIRKELLANPQAVERFYREVEVISRLTHPHVVQAYDAGPVGATHFLVMEHVE